MLWQSQVHSHSLAANLIPGFTELSKCHRRRLTRILRQFLRVLTLKLTMYLRLSPLITSLRRFKHRVELQTAWQPIADLLPRLLLPTRVLSLIPLCKARLFPPRELRTRGIVL